MLELIADDHQSAPAPKRLLQLLGRSRPPPTMSGARTAVRTARMRPTATGRGSAGAAVEIHQAQAELLTGQRSTGGDGGFIGRERQRVADVRGRSGAPRIDEHIAGREQLQAADRNSGAATTWCPMSSSGLRPKSATAEQRIGPRIDVRGRRGRQHHRRGGLAAQQIEQGALMGGVIKRAADKKLDRTA